MSYTRTSLRKMERKTRDSNRDFHLGKVDTYY